MTKILSMWHRVIGWPLVACENCGRVSLVWLDHRCSDACSETWLAERAA